MTIVGHELGHLKLQHIRIRVAMFHLRTLLLCYLLSLFMDESYAVLVDFGFTKTSPNILLGCLMFKPIIGPLNQVITVIERAIRRRQEYKADHFAHSLGLDPSDSLVKLYKCDVPPLLVDPIYNALVSNHPSLPQRLHHLKEL
eukprot:gene7758-9097_t